MNKMILTKFNKKKVTRFSFVMIPFLIIFSYFYVIGRSRYEVKSYIVIRKASEKMQRDFNISSLLGSGNSSSKEDSLFMRTYLKSPEVLEIAERNINFSKKYERKFPDLLSGIAPNHSKSEIYQFFKKQINVSFEESSGILEIRTNSYDAKTGYDFNKFLINQSEIFANELNQNIFKRQLDFVNNQVTIQANKVEAASRDLLEFQRKNSVINPRSDSNSSSKFIAALESELVKLKVELAGLKRKFVSEEEPEIIEISNQILEISEQINEERSELVSPNGKNLNLKILTISDLENKLKFALDLYKAAITTAETTRVDSLQKQRFMAVISSPQIPDEEANAWRHKGFFSVIGSIFLLFGVFNFFKTLSNGKRY